MGSKESLRDVLEIIKSHHGRQVVVVSAMSGVTDTLLEATRAALAGRRSKVKKELADLLLRHVEMIEKMMSDVRSLNFWL